MSFSSTLSQVVSVSLFNLRGLPGRKGAALSAAVGIAGVVAVLTGVLAIGEGFRKVMSSAGVPDAAIVLRAGSDNEMNSGLTRDDVRVITDAPGIARGANGPLTSPELFVIIDLKKTSTGTDSNVPLRGVGNAAFDVRGNIQVVKGRRFESGKNEIMIGAGAAASFSGQDESGALFPLDVGRSVKVGQHLWEIVGVFTAGGGVAESELWTDSAVLQPAYHREDTFQSVYAKLTSPDAFQGFKDSLTSNPAVKVQVQSLNDFYSAQSELLTQFVTVAGVFIASLMALGALFGALNTMYSAVSSRAREIATLRALGFPSLPVVVSVLAESLALSLAGGLLGAAGAWLAFDGYQASTMNFQTFSQVSFSFAVTPALLVTAIIWAAALGLLGGIFPAWRAARLPIATALRDT